MFEFIFKGFDALQYQVGCPWIFYHFISDSVFMLCAHSASYPFIFLFFFAFVGASRLWNHPVFESRVQQSCGAGEHLQGASADHSGKKRTRRLFFVSRYWTCLTFLFLWPTVHPPRWCSEAGPGWTAGHRWGCSHPSPSGQETARALSGFHGLHHQWVRNGAFL